MKNKKQTAINWLVEKIKPLYIGNFEMTFLKEINQAKEIEKEQMIEFGETMQEIDYYCDEIRFDYEPKKYFEEKFKQ